MQFLNIYVDRTNHSLTVHRPFLAALTIKPSIHAPPITPLDKHVQDTTSPPPSRDSPTSRSLVGEISLEAKQEQELRRTTTRRVLVKNVDTGKNKVVIIQSNSLADLRARCKEIFQEPRDVRTMYIVQGAQVDIENDVDVAQLVSTDTLFVQFMQ